MSAPLSRNQQRELGAFNAILAKVSTLLVPYQSDSNATRWPVVAGTYTDLNATLDPSSGLCLTLPYDYGYPTSLGPGWANPKGHTRFRICVVMGERLRVGWGYVDETPTVRPFAETIRFLDCVFQHVMEERILDDQWVEAQGEMYAKLG